MSGKGSLAAPGSLGHGSGPSAKPDQRWHCPGPGETLLLPAGAGGWGSHPACQLLAYGMVGGVWPGWSPGSMTVPSSPGLGPWVLLIPGGMWEAKLLPLADAARVQPAAVSWHQPQC